MFYRILLDIVLRFVKDRYISLIDYYISYINIMLLLFLLCFKSINVLYIFDKVYVFILLVI